MLACLAMLEFFLEPGLKALWGCLQNLKLQTQGSLDLGRRKKLPAVHLLFVLAIVGNASALLFHQPMKIIPHLAISQMPPLLQYLYRLQTLPL